MRRVLILEPDPALRGDLVRAARDAGHAVTDAASPDQALGWLVAERYDALLVDLPGTQALDVLSRLREAAEGAPVVAMSGRASSRLAIEAVRRGAFELLAKPFSLAALESALAAATGSHIALPAAGFVTRDPATARTLKLAERSASSHATVLIEGESGTGKALLARHLHAHGERRWRPFSVLDPTGPEQVLERLAQNTCGGTLLVPGVGDASEPLQRRLLELLLETDGTLPEQRPRIVATTLRPVAAEVETGRLREDLALRLAVVTLHLLPLRERPDDVAPLARRLLERHAAARGVTTPRLTEKAILALRSRSFRGNVRELENLMSRMLLLATGPELCAADLDGAGIGSETGPPALNLRELEREAIERSLAHYGNNRTRASQALGISTRTLRNKLQRYGLR